MNPHPRLKVLPVLLRNVRDAEQLCRDLINRADSEAKSLKEMYNLYEVSLGNIRDEQEENVNRANISHDTNKGISVFYSSLRQLRETYRANGNEPNESLEEYDKRLLSFFKYDEFSGEESNGKFLDLQLFFNRYINLTKNFQLYYYHYIRNHICEFDSLATSVKLSKAYQTYLEDLIQYLLYFAERAHPLDNVPRIFKRETESMKQAIDQELRELSQRYGSSHTSFLQQYERNEVSDDELKAKLVYFCLKAGGKPVQRIERLWALLESRKYNRIFLLQKQVRFMLATVLPEERDGTIANVQKKLTLSYQEIEQERKDEDIALGVQPGDQQVDGHEEKQQLESTIYNPKDVPLGWDGKPIPYWMYKLHGLNHEFKCEICGGAIYKGPRVFERHFTEATHIAGLKRLGITFSKAFLMITRIQDALQLHQRLMDRQKNIQFDVEREVEVEDDNGNVMNLKTFNDLKRQGLL